MSSPDPETMRGVAAECVKLVGEQYGRQLDWSLASLGELDEVCQALIADGPLTGQRLELWWQLAGAYTGEVTIRLYEGQWISDDERGPGYRRCRPLLSIHGSRKRREPPWVRRAGYLGSVAGSVVVGKDFGCGPAVDVL